MKKHVVEIDPFRTGNERSLDQSRLIPSFDVRTIKFMCTLYLQSDTLSCILDLNSTSSHFNSGTVHWRSTKYGS